MDDNTNHKLEPFLRSHYTDILALSKLFCITNDMTLDECLKAFDINIEEAEDMKNEWETDVEAALKKLAEEES